MHSARMFGVGLALALASVAASADGQVREGPYPDTALSGGGLIWYTGHLDLTGRRFDELDAICRSVPVSQVSGWRAPTERELRTLLVEVPKRNAVATWTELEFANAGALVPTVPPFAYGARIHPQIQLVLRDLYTYEGTPTSYDRIIRGRMYIVQWFDRWTLPTLTLDRSIRHNPAGRELGPMQRLLCVAEQ